MLCSVMKFEKSWNSWNSWKSSLKGVHFGFHLSVHLGVSFGIHLVGPTFFIYQKKQTLHCYYFRVWIKKHVLFASISHVTNYYLKGMSNIRQNLNSFSVLKFSSLVYNCTNGIFFTHSTQHSIIKIVR